LAGKPPVNAPIDGQGTNKLDQVDSSDLVWALKDINLTIQQGDIVGIIGKNGAGKSTLLKILSKITTPTTGKIKVNGRMASLLEVGTGMHPELSGRDNIYLNGAILGMRKHEITSKLDDIVDFSGIAKYIDTPIKRYSSGMRVRLGFAISAFLEPEILVVDEVLAVGDAEFQKRAIGKMQDISHGNGRTVLFVSHNMTAVRNLCKSGVVLGNGTIKFKGTADEAIDCYLSSNKTSEDSEIKENIEWIQNGLEIDKIEINNTNKADSILKFGQNILDVTIKGISKKEINTEITIIIENKDEVAFASYDFCEEKGKLYQLNGEFNLSRKIQLPAEIYKGELYISIYFHEPNIQWFLKAPKCCKLSSEGHLSKFGQISTISTSGLMRLHSVK
jgi:lipopolysaccharide transport system ATP-binding protein